MQINQSIVYYSQILVSLIKASDVYECGKAAFNLCG